MSKQNKVNPGQYTQAGRLSPDDAARERRNHNPVASERTGTGQKAVHTQPTDKPAAAEPPDAPEKSDAPQKADAPTKPD